MAVNPRGVLEVFSEAVPEVFFDRLSKDLRLPVRQRIFSLPVVVWLMISQRLDAKATLSTAVQQVVQQRPRMLLSDHKRIRERTMSCHTGAYSDARQRMPVVIAEKVADSVFDHLMVDNHGEVLPGWKRRVFILDGSSLEMPHTPELAKAYPPHPKSHWPVLLMLVAQDLITGLAVRPSWGPMYGTEPVSEQALMKPLMGQLPEDAVLMGDINFGVFSVAFASAQSGHDVLLRLLPVRAAAIGRGLPLQSGLDREVNWQASAYERKRHPDLPDDACVRGRLIQQVKASDGSTVTLYLFTTLPLTVEELVEIYGRRWNVETDLRSLKRTVDLQVLRCKTVDMIAKELVLAIAGYNLVRAVMNAAAQQYQLDPRRLSFSRSQDVVNAAIAGLEESATPAEYQLRLERMLRLVASCKLPNRSKIRSTPRHVWGHGCKFSKRKVTRPGNR
jgi:hypothetical protein